MILIHLSLEEVSSESINHPKSTVWMCTQSSVFSPLFAASYLLEGSSLKALMLKSGCLPRTRAVSLDFSLYNVNTDLLAVFSFLFEFPVSERAQSSLDLSVITLWPITGLDLQLLLVVSLLGMAPASTSALPLLLPPAPTLSLPVSQLLLLALVLYFLVRGIMGFLREGYAYLLSVWRILGICKLALAASVCGLHLSRCAAASLRWAELLRHHRDAFTDFQPLARQSHMYIVTSALLLFVLVLKVTDRSELLRRKHLSKNPHKAFYKPTNCCFGLILCSFSEVLL